MSGNAFKQPHKNAFECVDSLTLSFYFPSPKAKVFSSPRQITFINGRCKTIYLFIRHRLQMLHKSELFRVERLMQLDERMATCAIDEHTHKSLRATTVFLYYKSIFYSHHRFLCKPQKMLLLLLFLRLKTDIFHPAELSANGEISFIRFPFSFNLFLLGFFTQCGSAMNGKWLMSRVCMTAGKNDEKFHFFFIAAPCVVHSFHNPR